MKTSQRRGDLKPVVHGFRLWLILTLLMTLSLTGCAEEKEIVEKGKPVKTISVEEKEETVRLQYFGITNSEEIKKYSFKVSGKMAKIYVEKGQEVKKGQLLVELDKSDLRFAQKAAEQTMNKAQSAYRDATTMYENVKVLEANGASSKRELELAKLDMEVKQADYNSAKVDYDYKSSMISDANLYADIDGFVIDILNKEGEITGAGYPVIAARSGEQVVNIGLSQEDIQKVTKGTKATLIPVGAEGNEAKGEITLIDQVPDMESRTYNAKIKITSVQNVSENVDFYLGSSCKVFLDTGKAKGIWIPLSSIQNDVQDYVYIVKEDRAQRRNIKILSTVNTLVRVEGIDPGNKLVTAGMKNLSEGCLISEGEKL